MTMYYKDGFYAEPQENSVEITDEQYEALLIGQSEGKQICADKFGNPILVPQQPSEFHHLNLDTLLWEIPAEKQAALLNEQRASMWERIKQKRHDNLRGGVFVASIGKWFHSNDESRQQYTFMRTLAQLPNGMTWKTMDNTFVPFNKAILDELSLQLIQDEQADFKNAERHKALMEQVEKPLDYDFSDGWTPIFTEA